MERTEVSEVSPLLPSNSSYLSNHSRSFSMSKSKGIQQQIVDIENGEISKVDSQLNGDLGYGLAQQSLGLQVDDATNKKLLKKADLYICTMMCLVYSVQYMDKQTNSYASIMGLREDLNMTGNMYSWVGTSFYLGYLFFEIPSSLALQKFPIAKTSGIFIIAWGIVLCTGSVPKTYAGFMVTRVILGILESAVTPSFMLLTSQWYKREEQLFRTGIWSSSAGLGAILGALIAYGLAKNQDTLPVTSWRLLYIILGVITVGLGCLFLLHVPDTPANAWFLNENERIMTVERIRSNKQGFGSRHFKWYQVREVFRDIRTYLYFFAIVAAEIPNGGIGNFGSIMIKNMGYKNGEALLLGAPFGAVEFVGIAIMCWIAEKYQQRMICAMVTYCMNIFSSCLLAFAKDTKTQLAGYYLQGVAVTGFICFISCVSSNSAGHTKKVVTGAICMIGYCVGNLIGPQTFVASEEPHYHSAKIAIVVCFAVDLVLTIAVYIINKRENKKRDLQNEQLEIENSEFADLTDFENPEFRYAL